MSKKRLKTVGEVIDTLGIPNLMRVSGAKTPGVIAQWKFERRFPARTYLVIYAELLRRGLEAPPALWGMVDGSPVSKRQTREDA